MQQWIAHFAAHYGALIYPVILVWTFLEGETVVLATGALISGGLIEVPLWGLILCAFVGSAAGDQTWYFVGRKFGQPMLARRPRLRSRMEPVLALLDRNRHLYILVFRFIYGLRSVSPFIIGFCGIAPRTFVPLNLVAALIWSTLFTCGGFFIGIVLDLYLDAGAAIVIGVAVGVPVGIWAVSLRRKWLKRQLLRRTQPVMHAIAEPEAQGAQPPAQ